MRPFSILIKPACADCNLRCSYCFYLDHAGLYPDKNVHRMSRETLEILTRSYMQTEQPQYIFSWQGGEPTLMGLEFFQYANELQKKYGKPGVVVGNGLQTNGTLIDAALARHFAEYKYLLGVSLDGPPEIHDHYRKNVAGQGTHEAVMRGIGHLRDTGVEFNILTLVNDRVAARPRETYRYLCDNGFLYQQYIPCVEFDAEGNDLPFAVRPEAWGEFLCGIFDEWYPNDIRTVSIRNFDTLLSYLVDGSYVTCTIGRNCCHYFVCEHNGDIYPCDFFVEKDLYLGNLATDSWEDLLKSKTYLEFGRLKSQWNAACADCEFLSVCSGDCLKHRLIGSARDPKTLSRLCAGWKLFFEHALHRFKELAEQIKAERRQAAMRAAPRYSAAQPVAKPKPNDPCPCHSGKKYKKCCGRGGKT